MSSTYRPRQFYCANPMTTRAWGRVASADVKVQRQAAIYHWCCKQMVALNAGGEVLDRYKVLKREDLKISAAIADPNARGQGQHIGLVLDHGCAAGYRGE